MTAPETATGVADTAFLTAAFRMLESERSDALFVDPLAARLAGDKGKAMLAGVAHLGEIAPWSTVIRTTLIDGFLTRAVDDGVTCVLNLGAGLDTRPYRLDVPSTLRWVEVDLPAIIALKDERLAGEPARCTLERIPLDLTDVDARRELLARLAPAGERVFVLTEGVAPYLSEDDVAALADDLRARPFAAYGWLVRG